MGKRNKKLEVTKAIEVLESKGILFTSIADVFKSVLGKKTESVKKLSKKQLKEKALNDTKRILLNVIKTKDYVEFYSEMQNVLDLLRVVQEKV